MRHNWLAVAILAIFLTVASSSIANAQSLTMSHDIVDNNIASNEVARFKLTVTNLGEQQELSLVSPGHKWDVSFSDYLFELGPNQQKTVDVTIAPPIDTLEGSYGIQIYARDIENPLQTDVETLVVNVIRTVDLPNYGVTLNIDVPESISEGGELEVKTSILNNRNSNLQYVTAKVRSELFPTRENLLKSVTSKEVTPLFEFTTPLDVVPGDYDIFLAIYDGDTLLAEETKTIAIEATKKTTVTSTESAETFIFDKKHTISITNTGATKVTDNVKLNVRGLKKYILSTQPLAAEVAKVDGSTDYIWTYTIEPGETFRAQYTFGLNLVAILILAALAALFSVYKRAYQLATIEKDVVLAKEKGEKFIKIKLKVKNRSQKVLERVTINDHLPLPFKLIQKFGTLHPDGVSKKGTRINLRWKLGQLGPREERYLSYGAKATLGIIGRVILPPAKLQYKFKNALFTFRSNRVSLEGKPRKTKKAPEKIKISKIEEETPK